MGGIGTEREVSLKSGENIASAVRQAGLEVITADIRPDDMGVLDDGSIDMFFPALHGEFGEDGQLQEILERKKLAYAGSGPEASRNAFDKMISKKIFQDCGLSVPWGIEFDGGADAEELIEELGKVGERFVVKPIRQGSSVGVEIVATCRAAVDAAKECLGRFGNCMIERFISGRLITVGVINGRALPIIEIKSKHRFYDYEAKYLDDSTEYLFDTITDKNLTGRISEAALACFNSLGCRHLGRADMILADDGTPCVLEMNTLPGFTSHSLLPMAANKAGLPNSQLCVEIIEAALAAFEKGA